MPPPPVTQPVEQPVVQQPPRVVRVPKRGLYVSENGGVLYNTQGTSFINDEEAFQYRQEAVTEMVTSQAKAEQNRARLVGKPISLDEAINRVRTRDLGLNTNPVTGAVVARGDVKSERPLSKEQMNEVAYRRFPTLALQAQASGLTREEQAEAISLPLATDAVRRVLNTRNPARQQQIINTMGPDMQALMIDIYNAWQAEAERNIAVSAEEDSGNVVTNAVGFVWDISFGPIFDGLIWASEKGLQVASSVAWMSSGMSPEEAWEASQPGVLDQTMVDYARKTYGDITIDVILEARAASEAEDPNVAIAELWDKYSTANDLDKLSILEQALSLSAYDQKTMDAITYLSTAETGNVGNIFSWSFNSMLGIDPLSEEGVQAAQSAIFSTTRNTVNVISLFAFDPFLVGAKFVGASKMYKYGLSKVGTADVDKAFQRPQVARFFDTLGAGLTKADEAKTPAEAAQIMNSLRSQYKNFLPTESLDALRWSGVRSGEDAAIFFKDAQYLEVLTKGQTAKRGDQITIPHMVIASSLVKRASLVARGLTYDNKAAKNIDEIFGAGVSNLIPEEAIPVIIKKLAEPSGDKFVGRMLSDFVFAKDTARRTFIGAIVGPLTKGASQYSRPAKAISRYGYQRKRSPRARLERISRTQAHVPDVSAGLRIDDGRDAFKVRDLMLYGGMPKYWAEYSADLWKVMTPGQRKEFSSGIGRSVGYSLGVDIVDPVNGSKLIDNIVSGARPGELYSPNYIDAPILKAAIERQTKDLVNNFDLTSAGVVDEASATVVNAPMRNPSLLDDGSSAALYNYQMTPIVSFPNMAALDQMSLRKSYLTMLLGDNGTMSTVTDYWTLGTIAGPRFFLRNGLEDAGLYALTGGNWKGYRYGQLYSKAVRESTQRIDRKDPSRVRGRKLGLVPSATRWFGDVMPRALNGIILPHLDEAEIVLANKLAKTGDREPLTLLLRKAFLRQKLIFIKKPKNKQILKDLDEAAENPLFYNMMDEASETTEGLASGSMVGVGANQTTRSILNGEIQEVTGKVLPYNTKVVAAEDASSIRAWYNDINAVLYGDGNKVETPAFLRAYYEAKMSGDFGRINDVVNKYAEHLLSANRNMVESSAIGATEGAASLARRKLDAALQTFTTKNGSFNDDLLAKLRREETLKDGTTKVTYKMYDMVDGKQVQRLAEEDLLAMPGKPYSALGVDNMTLVTSEKIPLSMRAWSAMGRSLARFTREPIFVANYLDARDFLRPIQTRLAGEFGEEYATKWAVENAYERAYATTMSYVDNPNVRSQLAWNVRNVARFYRAQEDFYRRMMRTVRNNPLAIQRLNLAWHALDETGFVHENEFGEKYFVWPGNKATLTGINTVTSLFGLNVLEGGMLTEFTSKVSMLTPSADPNAAFPTLAGPWGATAFTGLMKIFPQLKSFQDEIMGEYSVGRSYWETVVPTNAKKSLDLFNLAFGLNDDLDSDTVYADSARSAIQVYASTGLIEQGKQYTNTELADIRNNLNIAANDITILRTLAGPTLPATVSVNPQTVTDFAKGMGVSGMRKIFIELLKLNDGDYSLAYSKFVKNNPGLSVFTVSENENPDSFGNFQATRETQKFIMENEELFKLSKTGSAFFAPQEGVQSLGAWKYLASMGAKAPKNVLNYFNEMVTAEGYGRYRLLQKQYYDGIDAGDDSVKNKWANAKIELYREYPMLQSRLQGDLSDGSTPNASDYRGDVGDIRTAVNWMKKNNKLDQRGLDAESVIGLYDQMSTRLNGLDQRDPMYAKNKKELKDTWGRVEASWSPKYEDDIQWRLLMNATSGALEF